MKFNFSAIITKGDIAFVAQCPELGVVSQGKTEKSAEKNLREAVALYLEDNDIKESLKEKPIQKARITSLAITA